MKFYDTRGKEYKVDIRPSKWKRKAAGEGRGKFQSRVGEILADRYPGDTILEEFPIPGERLTLDFFLPRRRLAVEVQGQQHYKFNSFFHKDKYEFRAAQERDLRKVAWCGMNNIDLIKIDTGSDEEFILKHLP